MAYGLEETTLEEREISQAVIGRLPRYFRYLGELKDEDLTQARIMATIAGGDEA